MTAVQWARGRFSPARRSGRLGAAILAGAAAAGLGIGPLLITSTGIAAAADPCGPPVVSVIACENTQTGDPTSDWQITGSGSTTIQGFATSISVSPGDTVQFKINTPSKNYHFDILRMGYYQGNGARKIAAGLKPSVSLPQTQPACLNDTNPTGLIDCGNWGVSASWTVPTNAVSGVYFAHLVRDDLAGASSHIVFIVRNDASHSDVLFQTDDETWQAYNTYGGNSLYSCTVNCPPGNPKAYHGAAKVSYNRPFHSADDDSGRSWLMYAEYPMIRFMEANGYDVSYTTGIDVGTSAGGALIANHKTYMTAGHDEYWSGSNSSSIRTMEDVVRVLPPIIAAVSSSALFFMWVYSVVLVTAVGRTVGMMIADLRVVRADLGRPTFWDVVARYTLAALSVAVIFPLVLWGWRRIQPYDRASRTRLVSASARLEAQGALGA